MSSAEICAKPPNATLSPYTLIKRATNGEIATNQSGESVSDSQYWRYDVSHKRQKHGDGTGDKLCFKYTSSGSCPRGEKCHFRHDEEAREQSARGVCFEFLNKGKCERGPDCNFMHNLQEEGDNGSSRRSFSRKTNSHRSLIYTMMFILFACPCFQLFHKDAVFPFQLLDSWYDREHNKTHC